MLTVIIGLILASAFSAIMVYAQELVPGRVGMISGLFFGFAFGMGGIGAAVLGELADRDQHRLRLPGLRVPAADRPADRLPAEPGPDAWGSAPSPGGRPAVRPDFATGSYLFTSFVGFVSSSFATLVILTRAREVGTDP